jgi:hypothetical protein
MLNKLLSFKSLFISNKPQFSDIYSFQKELLAFHTNKFALPLSVSDNDYWDRYTHALILSIFFRRVAKSLDNWNSYRKISKTLGQQLGLRKGFNESTILELFILHTINHDFNLPRKFNIIALRANNNVSPQFLTDDSNKKNKLTKKENVYLLNNLRIIMRVRGYGTQEVWGDNDIIVCIRESKKIHNFCIISCKTSLRERVYQSIFWATHSRIEGVGKHVFLTLDKGHCGNSEIGSRNQNTGTAKKSRNALESTMDRVYVFRNRHEVNRSEVIKGIDYLEKDLIRWGDEFLGK